MSNKNNIALNYILNIVGIFNFNYRIEKLMINSII